MLVRSPTSAPVSMVCNAPRLGSTFNLRQTTSRNLCTGDKLIQVRDMCHRSSSILIANFGEYSPEVFSEDEEDHSVYLGPRGDLTERIYSTAHPRAVAHSHNLWGSLLVWASCQPCLTQLMGHWNDFYRSGWLQITRGRVYPRNRRVRFLGCVVRSS